MAVVLRNTNGDPVDTFGSGSPTNPFTSGVGVRFGDIAAQDQSAPGLFAPRTFGQMGEVNAGTSTATKAGSTDSLGYGEARVPTQAPHGGGGGNGFGGATPAAGIELTPDQEIGIPAPKVPKVPEKPTTPSDPNATDQDQGDQGDQDQGEQDSSTLNDHFSNGQDEATPSGPSFASRAVAGARFIGRVAKAAAPLAEM